MSSSFEAKDYQNPSKLNPSIDYHNLSSNDQTSLKSPPQHHRPTEVDPLKDHRLLKNHNQPSHQQPPAPTLYSNVEQPEKDTHAKLTSAEPPVTVDPKSKNYLSQPDGPPSPPPQQQQPPTRTLPLNTEKPDKQPFTLTKLTSAAEPVTNTYPKNYLSQSDEGPPSQTLPSKDHHLLKNSPLTPPQPQARSLPWNVEQRTRYKQPTNQVTSEEPKTDYPEHYLSQSDGPPASQQYPLAARTLSPKDQLKNLKPPPVRNPPPYVEQQQIYQQPNNHENLTSAEPAVTVYPEKFYLSQPPPPTTKNGCCSIL